MTMTSQGLVPEPTKTAGRYDAILIVGFGGPEGPDDVMPFLENVTRGRNVPQERLLEVAEHYRHFGGVSPINDQVRELIAVLGPELRRQEVTLPLYWGNRNWGPMLADTMREMTAAGVTRALAVVLAAHSSYSSCRQYREDIAKAQESVGPRAPGVDKVRVFYNHPDFIAANADRVGEALDAVPADLRDTVRIAFTAHSIPSSMAENCSYEAQLQESCRLVAGRLGFGPERWRLVYQSRSGPPRVPWLGPDILDHLDELHAQNTGAVVIHPIGFLSDHMEVLYDLDEEARQKCEELGMTMVRSATVGIHPQFVRMLAELVRERITGTVERRAIGQFGPNHDTCPPDCCLPPARPGRPEGSNHPA